MAKRRTCPSLVHHVPCWNGCSRHLPMLLERCDAHSGQHGTALPVLSVIAPCCCCTSCNANITLELQPSLTVAAGLTVLLAGTAAVLLARYSAAISSQLAKDQKDIRVWLAGV